MIKLNLIVMRLDTHSNKAFHSWNYHPRSLLVKFLWLVSDSVKANIVYCTNTKVINCLLLTVR